MEVSLLTWLALPYILAMHASAFIVQRLSRPFFASLCRLQDFLSEHLRRVKYINNASNRAAQLPQDVQLQIFHLLRARCGMVYRSPNGYRSPALRDLASARLVCQQWYCAATIELYKDVSLGNVSDCVAFANTLAAHPHLARFVRSLRLPPDIWPPPPVFPAAVFEQRIPNCNGIRWVDVYAAAARLMVQCTAATQVTIYGAGTNVYPLLKQQHGFPRLTHLSCCLPSGAPCYVPAGAPDLFWSWDLDIYMVSGGFLGLKSLTLTGYAFEMSANPVPFLGLHTLRIKDCFIGIGHGSFVAFLRDCVPDLRVFAWQRNHLGPRPPYTLSAAELLGDHHVPRIEACVLMNPCDDIIDGVITTLDDMKAFVSLSSLTIDNSMLSGLTRPPPHLAELIVVFGGNFAARGSPSSSLRRARFAVVHYLRYAVPFWLDWYAPSLRSIQLWDTIDLSGLRDWRVPAFLLRDFLARLSIDLAVNLTLCQVAENAVRRKFERRENIRRLLWRDVL